MTLELAVVEPPVHMEPTESLKRVLCYPFTMVVSPVPDSAPSGGQPMSLQARGGLDGGEPPPTAHSQFVKFQSNELTRGGLLGSCA
jgi:hypothetical protein